MRKTSFVLCIFVFVAAIALPKERDFPHLSGPYLGQKPPGMTPETFAPGIVSKEDIESKLFLTPDGAEIIFSSMHAAPGQNQDPADRQIRFISMKMVDGRWRDPVVLPFSREFVNEEPCLAPDGKRLFFASNRPKDGHSEAEKMPDIWMVERIGKEWSKPENAGKAVNTDDVEVQPFYSTDEKLYFCRRDGIYCAKFSEGKFQMPVKLDENTFKGRWSGLCISPDNSVLVAHARLDGGLGGWDLYASFKNDQGGWTQPVNLGEPVNSAEAEGNATFSPDGKYLFFSRKGDIYWISAGSSKNCGRRNKI